MRRIYTMRSGALSFALAACAAMLCAPASAAEANRAAAFRAEALFRLHNPCPSTGQTSGACKGYVIDRIIPRVCGGEEGPQNMQWQTLEQAKQKDRWERIGCRPGRKLVIPSGESFTESYAAAVPEPVTEVQPLR